MTPREIAEHNHNSVMRTLYEALKAFRRGDPQDNSIGVGVLPLDLSAIYLAVEEELRLALHQARRAALGEAAEACGALGALEYTQYNHTHLSVHEIRSDAFDDAARAIRALAAAPRAGDEA